MEVLCALHEEAREAIGQHNLSPNDVVNVNALMTSTVKNLKVICLLEGNADANRVDRPLDKSSFSLVSAHDARRQQKLRVHSESKQSAQTDASDGMGMR